MANGTTGTIRNSLLAIRSFNDYQRLAVFDRSTVFNQNFFNDTGFLGFDFIHQLHGFDDAQSISDFNLLADFDKSGGVRAGGAVERTDHG